MHRYFTATIFAIVGLLWVGRDAPAQGRRLASHVERVAKCAVGQVRKSLLAEIVKRACGRGRVKRPPRIFELLKQRLQADADHS